MSSGRRRRMIDGNSTPGVQMWTLQTKAGKLITGQVCRCGHLASDHCSLVENDRTTIIRIAKAGSCVNCDCCRFRWAGWIFAGDVIICPPPVVVS